ncbi:hypothetical protein ACJU26_08255 [Acidithiobacillus sp. M4-SHS-6]|uniref:hypothetical protein n=1 Tax=Acidithiobacillus sp. M4-SHS-6 TaxID=3383024 RepID=UPI0039BE8015
MKISTELVKVAYIDATQKLITGFTLLALALVTLAIAVFLWWRFRTKADSELPTLIIFIGLLVTLAFAAISLLYLLNIWNWVGISHPALFAAHQQMEIQDRSRPLL